MSTELDNQLRAFTEGRISRRELLKRATALGVTATLPAALLAKEAQAAAPKRGGHLRIGLSQGSTTDSLNPAQLTSNFTTLMFYTYLSQLTEVSNAGVLEPLLAESWEASDDATEWTFDLRKGIEFHNGKTLDADDVIASMVNHQGEDSTSSIKSFAELIEEMKKDGDHRVIFRLKEGNADFPFVLSDSAFGILPAKDGKLDFSGVGTGAYAIEDFNPGVRAKLKRNANYFKDDKAWVDSAEVLYISDAASRQNALVTDEIDVIDRVDLKTVHFLENNDTLEVLDVTGTLHYDFPMRTDTAPFDNNDVRMALKYAIDREEILQKVLRGYGALGNDHPISPAYRYFDHTLEQRAYDPDKAKFHLKQAGMENLKVTLSSSEAIFTGAIDAILLYREQAAKAGIDITLNRMPNDGYWSDVWMKHPWCASFWSGRPTEDWMFTQAYAAGGSWNETFWENDRFNVLLKAARAELDEEKRRGMYVEMQQLVRDDGGAVVPMFANHVIGVSNKMAHPEVVAGNWDLDGYKLIERWWFA